MKRKRSDWQPIPWKNGQGITHELYRLPAEGGFSLRLSAAVVSVDSPFSPFPGVDRIITLLEGRGFELTRTDGVKALIRGPQPFAFHGEDSWSCRLLDGPVLDFNVMVERSALRATVHASAGQAQASGAVLALEDGVRVGQEVLGTHDLWVCEGEVAVEGRCLVVQWSAV